ncbi:3-deoxy-D-manno-octulosonic acid transferase [Capnocytophaga gingivalis]|jgi:putative 3-deoxy-D-manno-octulosonic-acid transferase|uniref:3-deoxy-D-manno-octulosonic acid transferase n=1 Tax=Capnocytophaga gingivalis TaxID=1017 RepID=UPI0028EA9511|nr:glycosyltransferase N-terminal domain-containing protein [Capnocytophaga gingivalis]MEB3013100.1 glycosyltransferase N-terminal domain-containing protein [Capnocytophaga gingivalis]
MNILYTLITRLVACALPLLSLFSKKIKLFYRGRKESFHILETHIQEDDQVIWLHAASLGEYEQGLPIIKKLKEVFPKKKIVVTFFSPSGYEAKKHSKDADVILYLPMDIPKKVNHFLDLLHPQMAIFIKYEFWQNYLFGLKNRHIPTYLVSGVFRKDQLFFKKRSYGMRAVLPCFTHFFVQNENAKLLLQSIGFTNVTVSGDTRFDRVMEILSRDNNLSFVEEFLSGAPCMVFGSSWKADEDVYIPFLNSYKGNMKFIIAPHEVGNKDKILSLKERIHKYVSILSEVDKQKLPSYEVLIVDKIGLLTKIYSYASIAYVGGGMGKKGLHNILEPAVFSIPVVIGKNYEKFNEAKDLIEREGVFSIKDTDEFTKIASFLFTNVIQRKKAGVLNYNYIISNTGATNAFVDFVNK